MKIQFFRSKNMKYLLVLLLINISISTSFSQMRMSEKQRRFVNNAKNIEKDKFRRAYKRKDDYIVVRFKKTKWILTPTGYVDEIYVLVDRKWVVKED